MTVFLRPLVVKFENKMGCCTPTCQKWTTFSVGLFLIIFGILLAALWGMLLQSILKNELSLSNTGTTGYKMWKETPIPMYLEFYMWNWTNADEVVKDWDPKLKLKFEQCGPYTYHEHHIRENVVFNDNDTLTYETKRIWKFLPEKSKGSLMDKITVLNPIVATVGSILKNKHYLVQRGVNFFFVEKKEQLIITKTVDEYIFAGYKDPILDLVHKLNLSEFKVPFDRFGWFYSRNESVDYDGVFNMYNGADDMSKLGRIKNWNYQPSVPFYDGQCGVVDGTSGELWYPTNDDNNITVFASDVCSTVNLLYENAFELHGIKGKRYVGKEKVFDNGTLHPDMACFKQQDVPLASGVRNVSQCKFNAPAFVSYPHFYLADPSYTERIEGMQPNPKEHEFYIALEPTTGFPLKVNAAFQLNLKLEPIPGIDMLKNVTTTFVPMFWFRQSAEISEDLADQAKLLLVLPSVGRYTGYGIIGIGGLLLLIVAFITFRKGWKGSSEEEQLINQQSF